VSDRENDALVLSEEMRPFIAGEARERERERERESAIAALRVS
jgi:hypothetical protein